MKFVRGVLAPIAAILAFAFSQGFAQTAGSAKPGKPDPAPADDKERIEKIVHDYLIKNPSVLREAIEALQAQEAAGKGTNRGKKHQRSEIADIFRSRVACRRQPEGRCYGRRLF